MKKIILLILFGSLIAAAGSAQYFEDYHYISVNGESTIEIVPDKVLITLGVETRNTDIVVAQQENNQIIKDVFSIASSFGVDDDDMQTNYISVEPYYQDVYDYNGVWQGQELEGYYVRNSVVLTLTDLSEFEDFITSVLESGVNYVHGIQFSSSNLDQYKNQARIEAIQDAKMKAQMMAEALGMEIGEPITIYENQTSSWTWDSYYWGYSWAEMSTYSGIYCYDCTGASSRNPIAPGQISVISSVNISFELK
ncbi:MAG: hypothetical protein APR63_04035 [Desulfuromonas sp. SDB]|nr:MAG: hypothetical protein APR63_04035 [Desulfuromonas sp. SDB]